MARCQLNLFKRGERARRVRCGRGSTMARPPTRLCARSLARLGSDIDLGVFGEAAGSQITACQSRAGASVCQLRAALLFGAGGTAFVVLDSRQACIDVCLVRLTRTNLVIEILASAAATGGWETNKQKRNASGKRQSSYTYHARTSTAPLATERPHLIHSRIVREAPGRVRLNQAFLRGASTPMSVLRWS